MRRAMMNHRPAVILAALEDVHFVAATRPVKSARPVFSLEQKIRARLKVYALRVAIAVSPNLRPRVRASDKGIVAWHGAVVVQTQSFSNQRIQLLRQFALRHIARRDVKLAVGPEPQTTSGVQVRRGNVFDDYLAISEAARRLAIARDAHPLAVAAVIGVREKEEMV